MRFWYSVLLHLALPFVFLRLLWRSIKAPAYRSRWKERLGFAPFRVSDRSIWIHAVSVGEVQAAEFLIKNLQQQHPDLDIVVTTTTPTGSKRLIELFGNSVKHSYLPLDFSWAIRRFIALAKPKVLVLVETEIWPNLLTTCHKSSVVTVLANARLSQRSMLGYQRFATFSHEVFSCLDKVAAQTSEDASRFIQLGVSEDHVQVIGSVKFDVKVPASQREQAEVMRHSWGGDRLVWVAASTHEGEDEPVLAVHKRLLDKIPGLLLILVPRHPERFDRVVALVESMQLRGERRSATTIVNANTQVYIGDTMGELLLFLAAADAAFVGGSLVKTGGHNVLEASMFAVPVCFGSHVFNFQAISEMLLEQQAAVQVAGQDELYNILKYWLSNASERTRVGENGLRVVENNRGALQRLMELLKSLL